MEENKELSKNSEVNKEETVEPLEEETAKEENSLIEEELFQEEKKKSVNINLIVALIVIVGLISFMLYTKLKKNTYDLTDVFGTTQQVSVTLPHGYFMDQSGYVYTLNEENYLEGMASIYAMDCDEETYESYKEMYISYGGVEETLNNLDTVHMSESAEDGNYDAYLFYKNNCIYLVSFSDIELSQQLDIISGIR